MQQQSRMVLFQTLLLFVVVLGSVHSETPVTSTSSTKSALHRKSNDAFQTKKAFWGKIKRSRGGSSSVPLPSSPIPDIVEDVKGEDRADEDKTNIAEDDDDDDDIQSSSSPEEGNNNNQKNDDKNDNSKWKFSLYQEGDGSETDPDGIPSRFLRMQKHNRAAAKEALNKTLHWREEHDVDTILCRPHTKLDACKAIVPHFFAGKDSTSHVIFAQRPALLNLTKAHANNVSTDELITHYVYILEYCWNILAVEENLESTMTNVLDMTGLYFGVLRKKDLINFAGKFVSMMSANYPQRSYKTLVINTPKWFNMVYKIFSPLLRESTKKKISIYSKGKRQDEALLTLLGKDICECLPRDFFSSSTETDDTVHDTEASDDSALVKDTFHLEMEIKLRNFCMARLQEAGEEMQVVVS